MKKIIKIFVSILIIFSFSIIISIFHLSNIRRSSYNIQKDNFNKITNQTKDEYLINEQSFYSFDINNTKLNEIQMLASHNSYKLKGSKLGKFFIRLFKNKKEADQLEYEYLTLTNQLNLGIRSFELDIRYRKNNFETIHVPLVDNASNALNFQLALDEINLFSSRNTNHLPIIVILEIKDDFNFLDFNLKKIDNNKLKQLNNIILNTFTNNLIKPKDIIQNNLSINESVNKYGWPNINNLLGKVMFVIHASKYAKMYNNIYLPNDANLFISGYIDDVDNKDVSIIIHNNLDVESIKKVVAKNLLVRTRIDENLSYNINNFTLAINSNAQILTSDFLIARKDLKEEPLYFNNKHTVISKKE